MPKLELNHFFNKTVFLYQHPNYVKVSMDTILLSASINLTFFKNNRINVLDVGSGIGGGDVLLAKRLPNVYITGVEIQETLVKIAEKNVKYNSLTNQISFVTKDIKEWIDSYLKFDWVMTNPPFHVGSTSPFYNKSLSYTENDMSLHDWIKNCVRFLRNSGYFSIIHKSSRTDDIIVILKNLNFGDINIFPIFTKDKDLIANRVIIVAKKGAKTSATLHKEISASKLSKILQNPIDIYGS